MATVGGRTLKNGTASGQRPAWDGSGYAVDFATAPPTPKAIQCVGDSNTVGNDGAGGWRHHLYLGLREHRDDFELTGSHADVPLAGEGTFGAWYHDAVAGYKISDVTTNYATWAAALLTDPDVIIDMIGTNDVAAGTSAANMMIDRAAMDAVIDAEFPSARRVVLGVPPFVAGTTVAGNLAAWTAVRDAYNVLLEAYCTANGYVYLDYTDQLGAADIGSDGVHLTLKGASVLGRAVAEYFDRVELGPRRGARLPRAFRERPSWPAPYMATPATDKMSHATCVGAKVDAESFAVALEWFPTVLGTASLHSICEYGSFGGAPNFWGIFQIGRAIRVYFASGTARFDVNSPSDHCITPRKWHRIVFIAHRNGADSAVGLYVNGQLVGLVTGIAAWAAMTQQAMAFGVGPDAVATPSYYGSISMFKGATIPRPGTMAALRAVEADYYLGESLVPGAAVASFPISTTLADEISGGVTLAYAGGAASATAWPGGAPRRPWNYAQQPGLDNAGQATIGGGGTVAVAYTDIRANDVPRLAAVSGTGIVTCVVTPHVGFTLTGTPADVWAWEVP